MLLLVGCLFFSILLEGIHYLLSRGERRSEHILLRSAGCFFFGILGAYLTLSLIGGYLFDPFSLGRGDYGFFFFCFFIYAILFTGLGFLFPRPGKTRWKRAVLLFSLTLTLAFFLEVFLFNGRHYESLFSQKTPLSYSAVSYTHLSTLIAFKF